ncbi:MAG: hypothetical protein A4E60_00159 [Syntrophorhabdus sp. PtaB.Bin047]|jgi:hypothetical protein|nr:MAG: hypothetical protein A4E60_00159 [Syntrophorhabdus sp. PtaB.Bin047]
MPNDVFCINCRYDSELSEVCRNPKGLREVKTPWRLEKHYALQTDQNENNDCPWFEPIERPKGVFATAFRQAYNFLFR